MRESSFCTELSVFWHTSVFVRGLLKSSGEQFAEDHTDKPRKIFCSKELSAVTPPPVGEGAAAKMCWYEQC